MNLPASGGLFMSKMKGCSVFSTVPTIQQIQLMVVALATLSRVQNITQAILKANSAIRDAAINKEHLQRAPPFHKEVQEHDAL